MFTCDQSGRVSMKREKRANKSRKRKKWSCSHLQMRNNGIATQIAKKKLISHVHSLIYSNDAFSISTAI